MRTFSVAHHAAQNSTGKNTLGTGILTALIMVACLVLWTTRGVLAEQPAEASKELALKGERYEALVPDTLDLAERAKLAIHFITNPGKLKMWRS